MTDPSKKRLIRIAIVLLTAFVFIPVTAYLVGTIVVGPYEGESGLAGYLATIYQSALRGERAALTLTLSPLLIVIAWQVGLLLFRRARIGTASN